MAALLWLGYTFLVSTAACFVAVFESGSDVITFPFNTVEVCKYVCINGLVVFLTQIEAKLS